jgi:hypothetical protein
MLRRFAFLPLLVAAIALSCGVSGPFSSRSRAKSPRRKEARHSAALARARMPHSRRASHTRAR